MVTPVAEASRFSSVIAALPHPRFSFITQFPDATSKKYAHPDTVNRFGAVGNHAAFGQSTGAGEAAAFVRCCGIGIRIHPVGKIEEVGGRYIVACPKPPVGDTSLERNPAYWLQYKTTPALEVHRYPAGAVWQGAGTTLITPEARTFVWVPNKLPEFVPTDCVGDWGDLALNVDGSAHFVGMESGLNALVVYIDSAAYMSYQVEIQHHWEVAPLKPRSVTFQLKPSGFDGSQLNAVSHWMSSKTGDSHVEGHVVEAPTPGLLRGGDGTGSRRGASRTTALAVKVGTSVVSAIARAVGGEL